MAKNKIRKAVFPVGGLGTRFLPATKSMPKEMLTVVDKPLIHYAVDEARAAGIEEFIFVTGRGKTAIEDYFDEHYELKSQLESRGQEKLWQEIQSSLPSSGQIAYTRQPEPMGLGHAIWCAQKLVGDEPFAVILADDLLISSQKNCLAQMIDLYNGKGGNVLALIEVPQQDSGKYGMVSFEKTAAQGIVDLKSIVEKPSPSEAPSNLGVIGRYILQPEIFGKLSLQQKGKGGEIQLTDAIAALFGKQAMTGLCFDGMRFDCGSKLGFIEANLAFALRHPEIGDDLRKKIGHGLHCLESAA